MRAPIVMVIAAIAWSTSAHAQPAPAPPDHPLDDDAPRPIRFGAIGGVGFPRPLAIEPMIMVRGLVAIGGEYGVLPTTTIDGVGVSLWSIAGDVRVFPFRGPFFVGVRAGHQHIGASTTVTVPTIGSAPEELTLDSFFVNPRVGLLWTTRSGIAFGVEAGVQIPVGTSISSTLPLSLAPSAQSAADTLGRTVLPTVDLLRIGLLL